MKLTRHTHLKIYFLSAQKVKRAEWIIGYSFRDFNVTDNIRRIRLTLHFSLATSDRSLVEFGHQPIKQKIVHCSAIHGPEKNHFKATVNNRLNTSEHMHQLNKESHKKQVSNIKQFLPCPCRYQLQCFLRHSQYYRRQSSTNKFSGESSRRFHKWLSRQSTDPIETTWDKTKIRKWSLKAHK